MPKATSTQPVRLAHEPDVAWLIALWKAIHGGDPSPEQAALQIIAALSSYLAKPVEEMTVKQYQTRFKSLGITMKAPAGEPDYAPGQGPRGPYCFAIVDGVEICYSPFPVWLNQQPLRRRL